MENKIAKTLKNDFLFLGILEIIIVVFSLIQLNIIQAALAALYGALLFTGFFLAKKGNNAAGIIGMVVGSLMILTILSFDLIDCVLGIFLLIHSIKYNNATK